MRDENFGLADLAFAFIKYKMNTDLCFACKIGDFDDIKRLVELGANVNEKDEYGNHPLLCSLQYRNTEIAKYLIDCGANVDEKDRDGKIPLDYACDDKNIDLIKYLLMNGAHVTKKFHQNIHFLNYICKSENKNLIECLLDHTSRSDEKKAIRTSFMMHACEEGDVEIVKYLIECGADIYEEDEYENTAIDVACGVAKTDLVKFMLSMVCDDDKIKYGNKALVNACHGGNVELVEYLLDNFEINIDKNDIDILYYSCMSENIQLVAFLLERGFDINKKPSMDYSPFVCSCRYEKMEFVKFLINHGANVNDVYGNLKKYCPTETLGCIEFYKFLLSILYVPNYFTNTNNLTPTFRKHLIDFISDWKTYTTEEDNDLYNQYLRFICRNLFSIDVRRKTQKQICDIINDKLQECTDKIKGIDYTLFKDVDPVTQSEFTEFERMDLYQYGDSIGGKYRGITEDYINQCLDKTIIEDPLDRMDLMNKKSNVIDGNVFMDYLIRKMIKSAII